jgi:hypothetical protein
MSENVFKYCRVQKKVVPASEALVEVPESNLHHFLSDDIPPTKHPVDGKYYTSKARFREITRSYGYEEIGDAYERGYNPEAEAEADLQAAVNRVKNLYRERLRS